jgi:hypothetical protein
MAFKPWCNDCKTWHKADEGHVNCRFTASGVCAANIVEACACADVVERRRENLVEVRFNEAGATLVWRDAREVWRFVPMSGAGAYRAREVDEYEREERVSKEWAEAVLRREGWL